MVTRKAIVICAPGGESYGTTYLPGVKADRSAMKNYYRSEAGGCFYDHEIEVLWNPSIDEVNKTIAQSQSDYCTVYFSGHGYIDAVSQMQFLCLADGDLPLSLLIGGAPRQLIIIDACRNYLASIGAIPKEEESYLNFLGPSLVRELFDEFIMQSPHGVTIAFGSQRGQKARDTETGGLFTRSLIQVSTQLVAPTGYQFYTIDNLVRLTHHQLKMNGSQQVPSLYKQGDLRVPFAVAVPIMKTLPRELKRQPVFVPSASPNWNGVAAGLLSLVVLGAILSE